MPRGGKRPGAGRPKSQKPPKTRALRARKSAQADGAGFEKTPRLNSHEIKPEIKDARPGRGGKRTGAGRPRVKPSAPVAPAAPTVDQNAVMRERVALCASAGMDVSAIAAALGIAEAHLTVAYAHELANGAAIVRADSLAALKVAAAEGNAGAAKALLAIIAKMEPQPDGPPGVSRSPTRGDATTRALRFLQ